MKREFEITKDGSHTLFVPQLEEHYHSTNGAIQEANHVFIDAALNYCDKRTINVLEIGFGTGLNAFLTLQIAQADKKIINYTSLELYPISLDDVYKLNYPSLLGGNNTNNFIDLHKAKWEIRTQITPEFSITKNKIDFRTPQSFNPNTLFDVVYFDAFGPDKQPEMWEKLIFDKIYALMSVGGILTTYSAKGSVRRLLKEVGLDVERIPGPIGKREMLRATKGITSI